MVGSHAAELHQELLICASCVPGLELQKPARRQAAYEFAHGAGTLAEEVAKHFRAVGAKIREWMSLHPTHAKELAQIEQDVQNQQIRSAERRWSSLGGTRFIDLNYTSAESGVKKLQGIFQRFKGCNEQLNGRMAKGEFSAVEQEFVHLEQSINIPDSELGREALVVLGPMKSRLAAAKAKRRKRRITQMIFAVGTLTAIAALSLYVANEEKKAKDAKIAAEAKAEREAEEARLKAEREAEEARLKAERVAEEARLKAERVAEEARLKAERVAEEARIKAEKAYAKLKGNRAGEEREFEISPGLTMTFCWCPAGEFLMGSPESEEDRSDNEDQVKVTLSKGFWMAKTEVTQAQWEAVMGQNPSEFEAGNGPAENVSWNDVEKFLLKLNARLGNADGGRMVLPTESQWEYAARAGQTGIYAGGSLKEVAWSAPEAASNAFDGARQFVLPGDKEVPVAEEKHENGGDGPHHVGTKRPNAWGLHDMSGNVSEWCQDWYGDELPAGLDPSGPDSGRLRVVRGGGWDSLAKVCRVACRDYHYPANLVNFIGFRVVRISAP